MNNFYERFKDKISTVSKNGLPYVSNSHIVSKPPYLKSSLKSSAAKILSSSKYRSESSLKYSGSSPFLNDEVLRRSMNISSKVPLTEQSELHQHYKRNKTQLFKPYTLKDYQNAQSNFYQQLGGLGCSTIGTKEWKARNQVMIRKNKYSAELRKINYNFRKKSIQ